MIRYRLLILLLFITAGCITCAKAQGDKINSVNSSSQDAKKDTLSFKKDTVKKDTVARHNPKIATRRSAMIPGWGQAYNKEYWKIPLVYGILAIPAGMYLYNTSYYNKTKFAFEARFKEAAGDSSDVALIDSQLKGLGLASLQSYRNSFRRDRDYSILWFLLAWGLQVADATVFAHLKQFDVSGDLSLQLSPTFNPYTRTPGLGLTLNLKNPSRKPAISR
ncbi:MAG: DUF5683 domain-containing protein [Sediminibacterium sp.]|nr:DUF5683 domain-containing protein [Sediminibacterium sp.]